MPERVLENYGTVTAFVNATPELFWASEFEIGLHPQHHAELRRVAAGEIAAGAAAGRAGGGVAMGGPVPRGGYAAHGQASGPAHGW